MSNHQINIADNSVTTLFTAGKYCDRDIDIIVNVEDRRTHIKELYDGADFVGVEFGGSVTNIRDYLFYNCYNLETISLPDSITNISSNAFYNCTSLDLPSLPDGLESIGSGAFQSCTSLTLASLPSSVTSVGNYAFSNCANLTEMTFNSKPTVLGSSAFRSCVNLHTINVPWARGAVPGAPWGATNATINYSYQG